MKVLKKQKTQFAVMKNLPTSDALTNKISGDIGLHLHPIHLYLYIYNLRNYQVHPVKHSISLETVSSQPFQVGLTLDTVADPLAG